MIVLSVGMPRAGSGWHYNLIHDLMRTTGCAEAADIRRRYHLERVLTEVNCNIGVLSARRLALVTIPALLGNTFVIKAHSRPTAAFRVLRAGRIIRATYIYRDPRDAMLSAVEYAQRSAENGHGSAFAPLRDFRAALDFMRTYVGIAEKWMREPGVLISRYEDLLRDYPTQARRLASFFGVEVEGPQVRQVIDRYQPAQAERRQGTHFSQGRIGRFRDVFSAEEQSQLAGAFGDFLQRAGYSA
jgi:hypothetical protein